MTDEARKAQAAYTREYRKRNPEKVRRWRDAYWQRKADQLAQQQAAADPQENKREGSV